MHPDPFVRVGRAQFNEQAAKLEADLPRLSEEQAAVGLMQLVASLRDGHTTVPPFIQRAFRLLPLRFYLYGDELYLTGANRAYSSGIGGKLVTIGNVPAAEVQRRVRSVTPGDNDRTVDARLPGYIIVPEVLAGLEVIQQSSAAVPIELERAGRRVRLSVLPVAAPTGVFGATVQGKYSGDWVDCTPAEAPSWLRSAGKPYWFEYRPESKAIYVQYNQAASDHADPMPDFARRLRDEIASRSPERVILDLRLNEGGEAFWNRPLLLALVRSDELEPHGKLFVLIGRQTFSAATLLAIDLKKYTNAVFVGEPTGGSIQNYGNHQAVTLPNSGLTVMISTKYYQNNGPLDTSPWVAPHIASDLAPADCASGRDSVLHAALNYQAPGDQLKSAILSGAVDGAAETFRLFKSNRAYRYLNTEPILTGIGYELIRAKDFPRAITVMKVAIQEHPNVANAHDSLGDAYRAAGLRDAAIASYRRALEIAPGWESARQSLRALGVATPSGARH